MNRNKRSLTRDELQAKAVDDIHYGFTLTDARAWTLHAIMRSGKTKMVLDYAAQYTGGKIMVIVPTIEIADQWKESAQEFHPGRWSVGIVGGDSRKFYNDILVMTIASAGRYIDDMGLRGFELLVFDEAHRALSLTGKTIVDSFLERTPVKPKKSKGRVIFCTATLDRSDRQMLSRWSGGTTEITHQEMLEAGVLVDTHTIYCNYADPPEVFDIWEASVGRSSPTIIFCRTKQDALMWAEYWQSMGIQAEAILSDMSPKNREGLLYWYKNGTITVLTNAGVLSEGVDVNNTETVILAERPKSDTPEIQRVGRAIASNGIKRNATVIICGRYNKGDARLKSSELETPQDKYRQLWNSVGPFRKRLIEWNYKIAYDEELWERNQYD